LDHLVSQANALRLAGFAAIWLPPVLKTNQGSKRGADGYGPFDDYDIGSKNQQGSVATRFGTREQLRRCVAVLRGNGLDVYLDILPALNGKAVTVGRVWSSANSLVKAVLRPDIVDWTPATSITLDILAPDNSVSATATFTRDTPAGNLQTLAQQIGFHTFRIKAANTSVSNASPKYTLSATYSSETLFQPKPLAAEPSITGAWEDVFPLQNVAIDAHLVPSGKVLYWGRRSKPGDTTFASLNEHECHPFIFDPDPKTSTPTPLPKDGAGNLIFVLQVRIFE
jgi:hypothetical protein